MRSHPPRLHVFLLASAVMAALPGCGGTATAGTADASSTASSASALAPTPTPTPSVAPTPPPTPVPAPTMAAPAMVQVENAPDARPQSGLQDADVVYEYETEGGISRFSALWFHQPTESIGPVRSARLVTVKLTKTWGATLLFSGASQYVYSVLAQAGVHRYDEDAAAGNLYRISSRYAPHNVYTDGAHVAALQARAAAAPVPYSLWARTDPSAAPAGGVPALRVRVPVSNYEQPVFTYDASLHAYRRTETTGVLTDAATGRPWAVPTVVILQVPVSVGPEVEDVSGAHGLDFAIAGTGPAQILFGGQMYAGTFTQGASGPPTLALASGAPAPIGAGQVLIVLTRVGNVASPG